MNIIKLSAIDSTNDYLKINFLDKTKNDIHVVYTFNQTKGKGQRGNIWKSEPEKNLAFSVAFFPNKFKVENQFTINIIFSLFILNTLKSLQIPDMKIKWPNDIMSGNKKICGILNELKIKGNNIEKIVIGFGLNINQENFENLPSASSLKIIKQIDYDLNGIAMLFIQNLKKYNYLDFLINPKSNNNIEVFFSKYQKNLFGINKLYRFKDCNNNIFIGKIISVNMSGIIKIKKDDGYLGFYNFHEIKMIY
ncbi:biotin--[acetyl-CoA-carboxylase] ligase [Flavobacteriaceae bacterium]|nr:biotin--[acetyl-CoA-carboxylase] ligase [Flavobacteriaceae bacterium]